MIEYVSVMVRAALVTCATCAAQKLYVGDHDQAPTRDTVGARLRFAGWAHTQDGWRCPTCAPTTTEPGWEP